MMKLAKSYAFLLALTGVTVAAVDCGNGAIEGNGLRPKTTDITVTWLFGGKPANAEACEAHKGDEVLVTLSGTIDVSLHRSVTEACTKGSVQLPALTARISARPSSSSRCSTKKGAGSPRPASS